MRTIIFTLMLLAASQLAWGQEDVPAGQSKGIILIKDESMIVVDSVPDVMPEFPGGTQNLLEYLSRELRFPRAAEKRGVTGEVVVQFVIDAAGNVGDVKVVKSLDPDCDAEVVRVVQTLPMWTPGTRDGRAVPVRFAFAVEFK